jgi:hypothetical protein
MNSTPLKRLGYLMPDDINFEIDSVFVKESKENNGILTYSEPDFHQLEANQKNVLKDNDFAINSYVYLDFEEKLFDKSYDISVCKNNITKLSKPLLLFPFCKILRYFIAKMSYNFDEYNLE